MDGDDFQEFKQSPYKHSSIPEKSEVRNSPCPLIF